MEYQVTEILYSHVVDAPCRIGVEQLRAPSNTSTSAQSNADLIFRSLSTLCRVMSPLLSLNLNSKGPYEPRCRTNRRGSWDEKAQLHTPQNAKRDYSTIILAGILQYDIVCPPERPGPRWWLGLAS